MAAGSLSLVLLVSLSSRYRVEAENMPTTCSPNPCQNGGECKTPPWGHQCFCKEDYFGQFCEKKSPCATGNPCVNGGTCQFIDYSTHGYWCDCSTGYYGQNCENTSPCLTGQPCQNGGTCRSHIYYGYSCSCPSAYYGKNCEGTSPCLTQQPCKNGASCFGSSYSEGKYYCRCKPGYIGRDCEEKSKCLTDNPCLNGGTCHTPFYRDSGYYCTCPKEFRGMQCEHRQCPKNMAQCLDQNKGFYSYQGLEPAECLNKYRKIYQCFNKTAGEIVNLRNCDCGLSDLAHSLNEEMDPDVWSIYSCYFGRGDLSTTGCSSRVLSCISTVQRAQYFYRPAPCNDQTKHVKQQVKKCLDDYQAGNLTTSGKCAPVQKVLTFVAPLVKLAEKIWCTNCNVLDFYTKCLYGNKEPHPGMTPKYNTVCDIIGTPGLKNCLVGKVSAETACATIKDEVVKTAEFYLNQMKAVHQDYCQKVASFSKIRVDEWNCPATEE